MSTPHQRLCYGLPAEWLTGWLAAVGVTVLDEQCRLSWTEQENPIAVFSHRAHDPIKILSDTWPELGDRLDNMPGARNPKTNKKDPRYIGLEAFSARLKDHRNHPDVFSLTSSLTDLRWTMEKKVDVAVYGPFETAGTGPTKWTHERCRKVYGKTDVPDQRIRQLFDGVADRIGVHGLGLDAGRIGAVRDSDEEMMVEPIAETLAYFALALFPVRGDGRQVKNERGRQRGWGVGPYLETEFIWPVWKQPLDRWGIDALLTAWHNTWRRRGKDGYRSLKAQWSRLGIHAGWKTVRFRSKGQSDRTSGYGSERIHPNANRTRRSNRGY